MSDRKLKAWEAAGLIDSATADRIAAWEAENSRPLALWAVIGIAALAIGLGLISVVAANWDAIPGFARLGIHMAMMVTMAGLLWWRGSDLARIQPWFHEAALFVFGAMGLTFLGHIGQVYQTRSPLWQPVTLWLVLFAPLLLGYGRNWLTALAVMVALISACWMQADSIGYTFRFDDDKYGAANIHWGIMISLPLFSIAVAGFMRSRSDRVVFWRRLQQTGLIYAVGGATVTMLVLARDQSQWSWGGQMEAPILVESIAAAMTAGLVWLSQKSPTGRGVTAVLALGVVFNLGALIFPGIGSLFFWIGIAAVAVWVGWRGVFQIAVGAVALRLIALSFEWGDDLLGSGIGLILAGVLTLAIAWVAVRVARRFSPPREVAT
ncbi:MAG: hypothetical protein RL367_467 [Pseudomonadota bacterium]